MHTGDHGFVRDFLDEAFPFGLGDVEVQGGDVGEEEGQQQGGHPLGQPGHLGFNVIKVIMDL